MKHYDPKGPRLGDTTAESVINRSAREAALESHLQALQDRHRELVRSAGALQDIADVKLQLARTLVNLKRGEEAWPLGREALDTFIRSEDFESAADACDVLFQCDQPDSLSALGQGIWLTVTYSDGPGALCGALDPCGRRNTGRRGRRLPWPLPPPCFSPTSGSPASNART